jgi:GNAT superfamily N-acetyltransferase
LCLWHFKEDILNSGFYLDHMYILPCHIGKGYGSKLFDHLLTVANDQNVNEVFILSDPNATEFYLKLGCYFLKNFPSTIPGRTTPYLKYTTP